MTKTMNHANCPHLATKAARTACRKARAAQAASLTTEVDALIASYYDGSGDAEEIACALANRLPEVHTAYHTDGLDIDEVIAIALKAR